MNLDKAMKFFQTLFLVTLLPLGILMFIYAIYDDSPGGQILGVIIFIAGSSGLFSFWKKRKQKT